jgi:putative FmdB family regulatory protein
VPIFEFKCKKCEKEFEIISLFNSSDIIKCPHCDNGDVKRLLSPCGFDIKGFSYANGYSKGDK